MAEIGIFENRYPEISTSSPIVNRFSLFQGGPIYRFQELIGMAAPDYARVVQQALLGVLFTWVPLLILATLRGHALNGGVKIPFLHDYATNIRYLIGLPVLILAEAVVDSKVRRAVKHFAGSGLVPGEEIPAFEQEVLRINRIRNAWWPVIVMLVLAFAPSISFKGEGIIGFGISTWHSPANAQALTPAGWWFAFISVPIYRLLIYRWVWVIMLWTSFLKRVTKLRLNCVPTHPDRAAGLGFLAQAQRSFGLLGFAASSVMAGSFANLLAYRGSTLLDLRPLMIAGCVLILGIVIAPLFVLTPKLYKVKEKALLDYGALGTAYVKEFDSKWVKSKPRDEALLGTPDLQSLADLSNSFSIVNEMRYVLVNREILLGVSVPALLPMAALLLIFSPTEEVFRAILKLLL